MQYANRECNAITTIAKCTNTAASSNDSNHHSSTPAAWFASSTAYHGLRYQNIGSWTSLRSYTIVGETSLCLNSLVVPIEWCAQYSAQRCILHITTLIIVRVPTSSNDSNHHSSTPAAWFASSTAYHGLRYQNIGSWTSLRSYTIVGETSLCLNSLVVPIEWCAQYSAQRCILHITTLIIVRVFFMQLSFTVVLSSKHICLHKCVCIRIWKMW